MNKSDSERIAAVLESIGFKKAPTPEGADLIIINICSVRQSAVDRAKSKTKNYKLKTINKKQKTILTGCILKKDKGEFEEFCDGFFTIDKLPELPKLLKKIGFKIKGSDFRVKHYLQLTPQYQSDIVAYVPIMTGCNNFCAYCVVPYARGREISRPPEEILCEVKSLVKRGVKEIWLLGQNVNSYGVQRKTDAKQKRKTDAKINFAKLLEMVNEIPGEFWVRFTSSHPKDLTDELIETFAKSKKVTPYINLPIQSGDDEILKKMNRPYTVKHYKSLARKIRQAFRKYRNDLEKEVAISTDVIVGFPGEKRRHFENTKKLFKEIGFSMAYIARYSPRPQTAAFKLKDDVSQKEKKRREKILTEIVKESALKFNKKFENRVVDVLVLEKKKGFYLGKTRHHQTLKFTSDKDLLGRFVKVKVKKALPFGLEGEIGD
jgi:tRNA-2-methylthio-N6-dimethylallyladenosine synthase